MQNFKTFIFLLITYLMIGGSAYAAYGDSVNTNDQPVLTKGAAIPADAVIEAKLQTAYSLNSELNRYSIKVSVDNGLVTLDGAVRDNIQKDLAETIARDVEGVKEVKNSITVDRRTKMGEKRGDFGQKAIDATITAMVKSRLLANTRVSGLDIQVTTVNNVVTLNGTARSAEEKRIAGRLAIATPGVSAVKNTIKIKSG